MSLYFELSPVQCICPECRGVGRFHTEADFALLCAKCRGLGYLFKEGGPSFGCRMALEDCKPGQIATVANGDRGIVIRHVMRGRPRTFLRLLDPLFDTEADEETWYPSETGVVSVSATSWREEKARRDREDMLDPLRGKAL